MEAPPRPVQPSRLCQSLRWALELGEETAPLLGLATCPQFAALLKAQTWSTVLEARLIPQPSVFTIPGCLFPQTLNTPPLRTRPVFHGVEGGGVKERVGNPWIFVGCRSFIELLPPELSAPFQSCFPPLGLRKWAGGWPSLPHEALNPIMPAVPSLLSNHD